jgi:hypothetical protein
VRLVKERFVALAVDGRIVNYFHDEETEFLSKPTVCVANGASGGAYIVAAGGARLERAELHHVEGVFLKSLQRGLKAFAALPASEREPGAVAVPQRGPIDPKRLAATAPPPGALIVRVHNRQLGRTEAGGLRYTEPEDYIPALRDPSIVGTKTAPARFRQPSTDYMWVARAEWQALLPDNPARGQRVEVPASLCRRIIQFHLDPARGLSESDSFSSAAAEAGRIEATVEEANGTLVRVRLEGFVNLYNPRKYLLDYQPANLKKYSQSQIPLEYQPRLLGYVDFDPARKAVSRFDLVALGDVRGRPVDGNFAGERLGEANLLGIAFELVTHPRPADHLSPKGLRAGGGVYDLQRYLGVAK